VKAGPLLLPAFLSTGATELAGFRFPRNPRFPWHFQELATPYAPAEPPKLSYLPRALPYSVTPAIFGNSTTHQLSGRHSLNVMTTNASPALFSADGSGTGNAAAIHAATGQPVTPDDPSTNGEYLELFGTGFGPSHESGGFEVTSVTPLLRVADVPASVTFSGVPQDGVGLYQVNFIVPDLPPGTFEITLSMGSYNQQPGDPADSVVERRILRNN